MLSGDVKLLALSYTSYYLMVIENIECTSLVKNNKLGTLAAPGVVVWPVNIVIKAWVGRVGLFEH